MIHAERAQSATERALWRLMLDRMSAAAAVVALVALSMPGLANAKTFQIQAVSDADNGGMYIMFRPQRGTAMLPASASTPAQSWRLIVGHRNLAGPWACVIIGVDT